MRLDSSGNLGLGVTPSAWQTFTSVLEVPGGALAGISANQVGVWQNCFYNSSSFKYKSTGTATFYQLAGGTHSWNTAPSGTAGNTISFTTAMTLDASGNLLVGTTLNNSYKAHIAAGDVGNTVLDGLAISNLSNAGGTGTGVRLLFKLAKFESATENRKFAAIEAISTASNGEAIALSFYTQNSASAGNPVERARITSAGDFLVGTTTAQTNPGGAVVNATFSSGIVCGGATRSSLVNDRINFNGSYFYVLNASNAGVRLDNGATSWAAQSDERTKVIIEPIVNAIEKVSALRSVIGRYKTDEENARRSFLIAQDVQAVLPEAVSEDKDEAKTLSLRYTEVIPLLVAAIKELSVKVTALESK